MRPTIAERSTEFADALDKHVIGYCNLRPGCREQLVLCNKSAAVLDQELQHRESFWSQPYIRPVEQQTAAR